MTDSEQRYNPKTSDFFYLVPSDDTKKSYKVQGLLSIIPEALQVADYCPDISEEIELKIQQIFSLKKKLREDESNWDADVQMLDRLLKELGQQVTGKLKQLEQTPVVTEPHLCQGRFYEECPTSAITNTVFTAVVNGLEFWRKNETKLNGRESFLKGHIELQIRDRFDLTEFAEIAYQAKEVIAEQFGEETLKLHYALLAIGFRKEAHWDKEITVSVSKLLKDLGENNKKNRYIPKSTNDEKSSLPDRYISKEERIKNLAHQARLLKRIEVWVPEWRATKKRIVAVEISNLWDILSINEVHQFYTDGRNKIVDIEITYRPGIWFRKFADNEQLQEFGYITSEAMKLDPVQDRMALRLAYFALSNLQQCKSGRYQIGTLLRQIGYKRQIEVAKTQSSDASNLKRSFERGLNTLGKFQHFYYFEFDPNAPEWANPGSKVKKPNGWFEIWLELYGTIYQPDTLPARKDTKIDPELPREQQTVRKTSAIKDPLAFGQQVKQARKEKGETIAAMAKVLKISKAYLSEIENGCYPATINPQVEAKIIDYLGLPDLLD